MCEPSVVVNREASDAVRQSYQAFFELRASEDDVQ